LTAKLIFLSQIQSNAKGAEKVRTIPKLILHLLRYMKKVTMVQSCGRAEPASETIPKVTSSRKKVPARPGTEPDRWIVVWLCRLSELRLLMCREEADHLAIECWNIVRFTAGHQRTVANDFFVDPIGASVLEVSL